jgi:hypothetical protein
MILVGQRSLRRAICEFLTHAHSERNHRAWALTDQPADRLRTGTSVCRRQRPGGMLSFYYGWLSSGPAK